MNTAAAITAGGTVLVTIMTMLGGWLVRTEDETKQRWADLTTEIAVIDEQMRAGNRLTELYRREAEQIQRAAKQARAAAVPAWCPGCDTLTRTGHMRWTPAGTYRCTECRKAAP